MRLLPLIIILLSGCAIDDNDVTDGIDADFGRIGPVRLGMSQAQIQQAIGGDVVAGAAATPEEQSCYYLRAEGEFAGIGFMMDTDRLVRYDVLRSGIRTATGIGIGSTQPDVVAAYDLPVTNMAHKYTDGRYLVLEADSGFKLLFETDGSGVVTRYRSGREPQVSYVEGCS